MLYLFLSIFFTTLVFVIIKEFSRFEIDNFLGIVISYLTAVFMGVLFSEVQISVPVLFSKNWIFGAIAISSLFVFVFNIMIITAQKGGLSIMSVANKMSVVIPILIGFVLYNEEVSTLKISGILLAILGVWYTSKRKGIEAFDKRFWYLPFIIFIGSGLADSVMNHMQKIYVSVGELSTFSTWLFVFCALIGVCVLVVKTTLKTVHYSFKSILAGCVLGVPNYFSIYYLLKALSQSKYDTSLIFSLNNLLVVLFSVLIGVFIYKEKLSKPNYIGLGMSVFAIVILYLAV